MTKVCELAPESLLTKADTKTKPQLGLNLDLFDLFDLVAFLTVFSLFRISHIPLDMGMTIGSAVLVCWTAVRRSPWFWLGIVAAWLPRMYFDFHHYEDHCFFAIYWCGALGLARMGKRVDFSMRHSARLMIGLCFAIGFVWKIISSEFFESSLFHFKLLFDFRFEEMVTQPIGGLSSLASQENLDAYQKIRMSAPGSEVSLHIPQRVTWLAYAMTVWTIIIEGAISWAFLFSGKLAERSRDLILMFFMLSTYFVVPVMGFASVFTAMGVAQTRSNRMRIAYLVTHGILFVWYTVRMG